MEFFSSYAKITLTSWNQNVIIQLREMELGGYERI